MRSTPATPSVNPPNYQREVDSAFRLNKVPYLVSRRTTRFSFDPRHVSPRGCTERNLDAGFDLARADGERNWLCDRTVSAASIVTTVIAGGGTHHAVAQRGVPGGRVEARS
jgi:hypothetical protein